MYYNEKEIGRIYKLNEKNEKQNVDNPEQNILSEENKSIINKKLEKELWLNKQIISNIKFLTGFYLFYENIKNQTKESSFNKKDYEEGYMINEKLFKLYTKFCDYNKIKDILNNDNKIKLAIEKNKNFSNEENIDKISNELIKNISKDLKEQYINEFNEFNTFNELLKNNELYSAELKRYKHMEFLVFASCFLVKENLSKLMSTEDPGIKSKIN
jgi:hypothetical protein